MLPTSAVVEARRLTKIPKGTLDKNGTGKLLVALRRSELRKYHALNDVVASDARTRAYLRTRNRKSGQ